MITYYCTLNLDNGEWHVHANEENGDVYRATFSGPRAESRAREYATWKNVHSGGSYEGLNGGRYVR